jgi:hypothetical protein
MVVSLQRAAAPIHVVQQHGDANATIQKQLLELLRTKHAKGLSQRPLGGVGAPLLLGRHLHGSARLELCGFNRTPGEENG